MLLVAACLVGVALGVADREMSPSAVRLVLAAVVAWLAPLCWPGLAATPARTALRLLLWSAGAAAAAALLMRVLGAAGQPVALIAQASAMLLAILLLSHAAAAGLEALWRRGAFDAGGAREAAGRTVTLALTVLGALPLWLGPLAEALAAAHPALADTVLAFSPLTHLAVASDNDLLRNDWLYQRANLAALQVAYPELSHLAWAYAGAGLVMGAAALKLHHTSEKTR
jgi:small-conductance mechanosensitive channel